MLTSLSCGCDQYSSKAGFGGAQAVAANAKSTIIFLTSLSFESNAQ
jgi:hypothetical protein